MKTFQYILFAFFICTSPITLAEDIPQYVQEEADKKHITDIQVTTAKIKSIKKDGSELTIEFDGYAEIGSQKTEVLKKEFFSNNCLGKNPLIFSS